MSVLPRTILTPSVVGRYRRKESVGLAVCGSAQLPCDYPMADGYYFWNKDMFILPWRYWAWDEPESVN